MCGIVGFSAFDRNFRENEGYYISTIKNMITKIYNRGPDGSGHFIDRNVVLGHSRLSIIDIEGGSQPMLSACGRYYIVYNGEVYNMHEIKSELLRDGFKFNTKTDTEVILNAYIKYGYTAPKLFNGIFAFGIWDIERQELFLARDHFGVKPLYYTVKDGALVFSSKIEALAQFPNVELVLGREGLEELFGLFPSRTEGFGLFKNIFEVGFGEYLVYNKYGLRKCKYWELENQKLNLSYDEAKEQVRVILEDSIKKQMMSDVPISTFLSGGVDSSIITGVMAKELAKEGKTLDTYSFDFEGNDEHFQANSFQHSRDRQWVDIMVKECNTNHQYLECGNIDLIDYLEKAVDAKDYPGMVDVDTSLQYFCNVVSKQHKVVLTGECADEIFGGYPWSSRFIGQGQGANRDVLTMIQPKEQGLMYSRSVASNVQTSSGFPWVRNIDFRLSMVNSELLKKLDVEKHINVRYIQTILDLTRLEGAEVELTDTREVSYLNLKWFMPTLLERMDRMSMYSGLEARVPFADYRLVGLVFNLPWEYLTRKGTKGILRDAFDGEISKEVLWRKKNPYPKTYNPLYEKLLGEKLQGILDNPLSPIHQLCDKGNLELLIKSPKDYGKPWFGQLMAGPQLVAWWIQVDYWLRKYGVRVEV